MELLDPLTVNFFFISLLLHVLVVLADFLFEWWDSFNFIVGHSQSSSVCWCLIIDRTDELLTSSNQLLLAIIWRSQCTVNLLILLSEFIKVFTFQMIIQKLFELIFNSFILICIKSKRIDFFSLLLSLIMSFNIHLGIVNIVTFHRFLFDWNINSVTIKNYISIMKFSLNIKIKKLTYTK